MIVTQLEPQTSYNRSYVQWSAVIAGTVVALAIALILIPFGNGIGLSMTAPITNETAHVTILKVGVWILISQFISAALGGYFAGKAVTNIAGATEHENEFRDGIHGLLTWGLSLILTAVAVALTSFFANFSQTHGSELHDNAELLKKSAIIFNFMVGSSALVSGVIAWFFAAKAGHHRNTSADLSRHISFRRKA